MKALQNRGFGLMEMVMGFAAATALGLVAIQINSQLNRSQSRANTLYSTDQVRRTLTAHLQNAQAWSNTLADTSNTTMACLRNTATRCTHNGNATTATLPTVAGIPLADQPFKLRDATNRVMWDSTSTNIGMTTNGTACSTFSDAGNDDCPLRYELTWSAICTGECTNPQIKVQGKVKYRPATPERSIAMNGSNYNFEVTINPADSSVAPPPTGTTSQTSGLNGVALETFQIVSTGQSCGGWPGAPCGMSYNIDAICPGGSAVISCGYRLSAWAPYGPNSHTNSPDASSVEFSINGCRVLAGGAPGCGVCFQAYAMCARLKSP
ncbi:hypothetical protein K2X33_06925 [bacterium]|nr:hypothetical protein [bacterium]